MTKQEARKRKRILLKGQGKYDKIAYREKMFLLKGVLIEGAQIKETAEKLAINYSTAKTFLRKFKAQNISLNSQFICNICNWFVQISRSSSRCGYSKLVERANETNSSHKEVIKQQHHAELQNYFSFQKNENEDQKPQQIEILQQVLFKD